MCGRFVTSNLVRSRESRMFQKFCGSMQPDRICNSRHMPPVRRLLTLMFRNLPLEDGLWN